MKSFWTFCLTFVCLLWLGTFTVRSTDRYVSLDGTNDTANGYTNWLGAATNIQDAVNVATNGNTVWVSNGIYYLTNTIVVTNSIALRSFSGRYTNTVINGNYSSYEIRGVSLANTGAVLDGFTITNCFTTSQNGGGVLASPCKLITNCLMTGNIIEKSDGGGCYINSGKVSCCSIIGNTVLDCSTYNSGIYAKNAIISNCVVSGNKGINWWMTHGAFELNGSACTAANCVVSGNSGAGIWSAGASIVDSCIVSNNTFEGLYFNEGGRAKNCLIVGNGRAGIYFNKYGTVCEIDNCTIIYNGEYDGAVGIKVNWRTANQSTYAANSIIYHNAGGNWSFVGTNIVFTNCCTIPIPTNSPGRPEGTGNITNEPLFVDSDVANYRLANNSPCINKGNNRNWMTNTYDLDGRTRIRYGIVDMGAYERLNSGTIFTLW